MDAQLEGFLNVLAEAERAGGRVLHELTELAAFARAARDAQEGRPRRRLLCGRTGGSCATAGRHSIDEDRRLVEKIRAVGDFRGKLELLNRGQRWVIRKIEENVPTIGDAQLKAFLVVMAEGHRVNIGALED